MLSQGGQPGSAEVGVMEGIMAWETLLVPLMYGGSFVDGDNAVQKSSDEKDLSTTHCVGKKIRGFAAPKKITGLY